MENIKVGVIGTGFIGPAHIEALRRLGYVDVVALADVSDEVAAKKAAELYIPYSTGDYKKVIENREIKAVHICTPNNLHYTMSKEALLAGKHVICEKPLAVSINEAEDLISTAKATGLINAVHFNVRFYPAIHQIRAMIKNGELGEIYAVNGSYQQDWLFFDTDYNWRLEPKYSGKSKAVADIGSHWFDAVEFMTGLKTAKVCADFATLHPVRKKPLKPIETYSGKLLTEKDYENVPIQTEDYASVLFRFDSGAHGSCTVNQMAAGRKNRIYFEVYGSKAAVAYNTEQPNEIWIGRRETANGQLMKDPSLMDPSAREIINFPGGHNEGFPDTSKQLFKKVYGYMTGAIKEIQYPTFEAGLRELIICEKIVESARSEKWVNV